MAIESYGYEGIVAWGRHLSFEEDFIQRACYRARRDGAPLDVLYWKDAHTGGDWQHVPGRWVGPDEITNHSTREALGLSPLYHPRQGSLPIRDAVVSAHGRGEGCDVYQIDVWDLHVELRRLTDGRTVVSVRRDGVDDPVVLDGTGGV